MHLGFYSTKQYSRIARRKNYKGAGNRTFWLVRFDYRYLKALIKTTNLLVIVLSYTGRLFLAIIFPYAIIKSVTVLGGEI